MSETFNNEVREAIGRSFPHMTQEEVSHAAEAFVEYMDLVNEIFDTLHGDPARYATACALTADLPRASVEAGFVEPTNPTTILNS